MDKQSDTKEKFQIDDETLTELSTLYNIKEQLGFTQMSCVLRGECLTDHKDYAIKVILIFYMFTFKFR
jgi:hypothetical protein